MVRGIATKLGNVDGQLQQTTLQHASPEAYESYLKGPFYLAKFTTESMTKGIEQLRRATELDPAYAPAYADLGYAYWMLTQPINYLKPRGGMEKARPQHQTSAS